MADIQVSLGKIRFEPKSLFKMIDGFLELPLFGQRDPQIVLGFDLVGFYLDCLLVMPDGCIRFPLGLQYPA